MKQNLNVNAGQEKIKHKILSLSLFGPSLSFPNVHGASLLQIN